MKNEWPQELFNKLIIKLLTKREKGDKINESPNESDNSG